MLTVIVRASLRFRGVVIALACLLIGYGLYTLSRADYDVFPEFAPPQVAIQTEAPGLSPEQVEVLVTQPIENAINGVAGIESLRSGSIQGLSVITAKFSSGSDIHRDRQVVAERIASIVTRLPQGVEAPVMTPLVSSTGDLMSVGLTSDTRSLMELRTIADWIVIPHIQSVPGVAKGSAFGGDVRQLQVQVHPERLVPYNLVIEDVAAAARRGTGIRGAGFIDNVNQRIIIQTEGQSLTAEQLGKTVLAHQYGANVMLEDVADVVEGAAPPFSAASVSGRPGVVINVWAQYGANTLEVTRKLEQALEDLREPLRAQGVTLHTDIFRAANFIETATGNVRSSLLVGAALVILVLFLFLFDFYSAAISCTAIPLSLLTAVTVMQHFGYSLNTMTMGGLAIAIGGVVDDAVIDVENILRRARENLRRPDPRPLFQVVLDASMEVRSAVVYATFAVALVFIPLLTMSGFAGRLFLPLGFAYILATLASLGVALTVTPALCLAFLAGRRMPDEDPPVIRWLKEKYRAILVGIEKNSGAALAGVIFFVLAGCSMLPFLGATFIPELREGHFIVHMTAVPGTSIQESLRVGQRVTAELLKIPYVRSVAQRVGRSSADDIFGTHSSEFDVDLKPMEAEEAELAQSKIRQTLAKFPGVNFTVNTFLTERVEETLSGYTASVVVNIYGKDLDSIDGAAREIAQVLGHVPGAADVQLQSPPGVPQLMIRLRPDDVTRWGFEAVDVLDAVHTAYQGDITGQVYEGNIVYDISVILDSEHRRNSAEVGSLVLRNPAGAYVRLRQLADIAETPGRYVVLHEGARRVQAVTCNVAGRDIHSFVDEARKQIASSVHLPAGAYLEFGGEAEAQAKSQRDLLVDSVVAGIGIILLLSVCLGNARNLILVLLNVPFALVGGVLTIFISGGMLSIGSLVGFVTLFGITLRNSIMLISHYEHLVSEEGMPWGYEAALRGAAERLAPILMTATVTALGLLPLAIGSGTAGREIEGPMAIVILGGLVTSTALNLLVLPALALRHGRFDNETEEEH